MTDRIRTKTSSHSESGQGDSFLRETAIGRVLSGNLVLLVLVVAGGVGTLLLYGSYRTIGEISEQSIEQAMERSNAELEGIFSPIEDKGEMLRDWGRDGGLTLGSGEVESLNARLRPVVERDEQLMAVSVADTDGREYVAWQEGDTWVSRYTSADTGPDEPSKWIRWDEQGREIERWEAVRDEDARQRPWYQEAMATEEDEPHWTSPFTFFMTDEPGMTMSRRFDDPGGDRSHVLALGVSLEDVSTYTADIEPTEHGYAAVMTPDGQMVGLPSTPFEDAIASQDDVLSNWDELGLTSLGQAFEKWRDEGRRQGTLEGETDDLGRYWAGFDHFELGDQSLVVATVVPRKDLTGRIDRTRNATIGFSLFALLFAVGLGMWTSRRYRQRIEEAYDDARQLGQYQLETKLGVGGMGEVYRAEHGMLKRPTAVKLLKPELYDRESIKRFEREVQLSCQLTHPNTVTIFDYGRTDEGLFYYAMELLEGVTLEDFLNYTGPLREGRVIYLLVQLSSALVEAHDIGLIHRDIKPGNVMVGYEAGLADRITVLDFGLVRDIHAPEQTKLTQQDYLQGSPGYMAPEVILGEDNDTPSVDIFAVGALGYKLLCGVRPFDGESPVEIMMAEIEEDPPPPSHLLERQIDADLETLLMECLSKDPSRRPTAMELMERLLASDAAHEWTRREAIEWWEEHEDRVCATAKKPEKVEGSEAFEMTLTMGPEGDATIDRTPKEVFDEKPSVAHQGLAMEDTKPEDDEEMV